MAKQPQTSNGNTGPKVPPSVRVADGIKNSDSLQNLVTGLGTSRDKLTTTSFAYNEIDKISLEKAYRSDWIARKVVNIPAQDATRQWRTWEIDRNDSETVEAEEDRLQLQSKVKKAMQKARLYGGGALLVGVDGAGDISTPLDIDRVKPGALKFVHAVSRWELASGPIDWDITSPYYGQPSYYTRAMYATDPTAQVHPSRVVRFLGNEIPDVHTGTGWGDSILQVVQDAILAAGITVASGAQMLNDLKLDVIRIPGLSEYLSQDEYSTNLSKRFALGNTMKSLYNLLLLDKDEEWQRVTANLAGIPDLLKVYLLIVSGAADIPATRMLGQSPNGLNATGDNDIRNYYDHVKDEQNNTIKPAMSAFDQIFIRSALGTKDVKGITYTWDALWQTDEQLRSTIMTQKALSFKTDVDTGLIPDEILRQARLNQLIADDIYPDLQGILDDYGPLDPIEEDPVPGAVIGPDGKPILPTDPAHPDNQALLVAKAAAEANASPGADTKGGPRAVKDMATRVRLANLRSRKYRAMDGVQRTLYVYRPVTNQGDLLDWAKVVGIPNLVAANEMHTTIMYSRTPVDWSKTGEAWGQDEKGNLVVKPGGMRALQKFGNAIVLCFNSSDLGWRHCQIKESTGATWDYAEYQPHVTLAYIDPDDEPWSESQLALLGAYNGAINFGPEVFAEASNPYVTDSNGNPYWSDYNENHDPKTGQFGEGHGGGGGSGGGSAKSTGGKGAVAARVKAKVGAFVKGPGREAVKAVASKLANKENQKQLLASSVTFSLYHLVGLDFGADIEKVLHHEVHALAENMHIAWALAKDYLSKAAKAVRSAYAAAHIALHGVTGDAADAPVPDEDYQAVLDMFDKLTAALDSLQPPPDDNNPTWDCETLFDYNENHDPKTGEFSEGGGGGGGGSSPAKVDKWARGDFHKVKVELTTPAGEEKSGVFRVRTGYGSTAAVEAIKTQLEKTGNTVRSALHLEYVPEVLRVDPTKGSQEMSNASKRISQHLKNRSIGPR